MKYDAEERYVLTFPEHDDALHAAIAQTIPAMAQRPSKPAFAFGADRHIAMIGCFRPRRCGIATFTADVHEHLTCAVPGMAIDIYAMRAHPGDPGDPGQTLAIDENDPATYRAAAEAINRSGAGAVWLQHEFGIFGGAAGEMVLDLVDRIAAPLIVTLHTILASPSDSQRQVMERLVARASRLVVMSAFGRETLIDVYGADRAAVAVIEHGTPDRPFVERSPLRDMLGIGDRPVLSTFGLIGSGKGLETAIRALPAIVAQHPDVLYRIVGATHPNLIEAEGEAYRQGLEELADSLGVGANIAWDNRFLDLPDLLDQIELCDIYLAPYPNLAQITSGTLAYAVALGRAVVSTPFVHARELLANDVGVLLPDCSSAAISDAVLALLADRSAMRATQHHAYRRGRQTAWPAIAAQFADLLHDVIPVRQPGVPRYAPSLDAVRALSDGVGILQHGIYAVPDRAHGYCIDDNARALMLEHCLPQDRHGERWAIRYASFVQHAWNPDTRRFRNFMGFDRRWLEDVGSEDSNGRALWALGHCGGRADSDDLAAWGRCWFERTAGIATEFGSPRAIAFAMLGAVEMLARYPDHSLAREILHRGAEALDTQWRANRSAEWDWFEASLAYDNARLPEALIRAGQHLSAPQFTQSGLAALEWLCAKQTSARGHFRPVGSEGFGLAGETLPFDQQPVDAWATIDACAAAHGATGGSVWSNRAESAWRWFHGANDRSLALADPATGRCRDGLTARGINANVGAESVLAFHLAYQTMDDTFWSGSSIERANVAHADLQPLTLAPEYTR